MTSIADALAGKRVASLANVNALSLGTGLVPQGIAPSSIPDPLAWGINYWMWPWQYNNVPATALLNLIMDCTAMAATSEASQLLANRYCRGNVPLPEPIPLDDWQQVDKLEQYTQQYMNTPDWQRVRNWVKEYWV